MLIIIIVVTGLGLFLTYLELFQGYLSEDSFWHDEYEKERENVRKQTKELSNESINSEIHERMERKIKVVIRILCVVFISSLVFSVVLWSMIGSYEKIETTKYSLLPIQEESILKGQSKDRTYYIAESVNKNNTYMFFYQKDDVPQKMEIVADNIIKYEDIDCEPCIVKEAKIKVQKCNLLQEILLFKFDNNKTVEENYKIYVPKENYIKIFSY